MVKRRKRKEEKKTYEQLSFYDLFATGVEENNSEYFGSQKSTGIYGIENEEPTRSGSFDSNKSPLKDNPTYLEKVNYMEQIETQAKEMMFQWIEKQPLFQYKKTITSI